MALKAQDVLVLLKLVAKRDAPWTFVSLASEIGLSAAEVHAALKRAARAGLYRGEDRRVARKALLELLVHGARYVWWPERGALARGMPTAHAAPPLAAKFHADTVPPVWPSAQGTVRGESFEPLYRSVPQAAEADPQLYELLALVDAIRGGRARERKAAVAELKRRLDPSKAS